MDIKFPQNGNNPAKTEYHPPLGEKNGQELSKTMPLGTFLFHLAGDSMHYAMAGASPAGHTAQKNIRLLCMQADAVQDAGIYTIRDFLSFAADQASGGDTRAAAPLAENDNVIRIMTMHKSKGLQFPVVFCLGLDKGMKGRQEASVQVDAELGIALRYKETKQRISRKTAADEIFAWKKEREERAERIRLLYVAMTRAQERMFLAGITEDRLNWQEPVAEQKEHEGLRVPGTDPDRRAEPEAGPDEGTQAGRRGDW